MPDYYDEYSIFEVDPANIPKGPERVLVTNESADVFKTLDKKPGTGIIDRADALTKAYRDYFNSLKAAPAPAPAPVAPPVPNTTVTSTPPVEAPPTTVDTPQRQGAKDVEATLVVEARLPDTQVPREHAADRHYDDSGAAPPRSAEDVVRIVTPPATDVDFEELIRKTLQNEPTKGEADPSHASPTARAPAAAGEPVDLFSGVFSIDVVDLAVPTADLPICMRRAYRSGRPYFGPLGYGWDHRYNVYLRQLNNGDVALWSGQLFEHRFVRTGAGWEPEPGLTARLERLPGPSDVFAVVYPGGLTWRFEQPSGWSNIERIPLTRIVDRYGNAVDLTYGTLDRLESVLDAAGRGLLFTYGSCDLLERVTDHTGTRAVRYEHDAEIEHLVRVVLPATGQYPKGAATTYVYDTFAEHPAMLHNILRVHDAADRLIVENEYAGPGSGREFNRIVRQRTAGFEYEFEYEQIQYVWPDPIYVDVLAARTLVRPPDGALHTYTFNYRGDLLDHRYRLNRDGSFRVVASQWRHDSEGNVTEQVGPDGLRHVLTYDATNADPCARRNLLKVEIAAPLADINPSRVVFEAQYEPRFQLVTQTENESGAVTRHRYDFDTTPVGATGRRIRLELPAVVLADGTSQQSVLAFEHDTHGRLTAAVTPEGGRVEMSYVVGGTHDGFLAEIARDALNTPLVSTCEYDPAGFLSRVQAPGGRVVGITHNALGQIEEQIAPIIDGQTAPIRRWFDDSGSVVRVERPVGDLAASLLPETSIVDEYERDVLGHVSRVSLAANTAAARSWSQCVDHEGRPVSSWDPLGTRFDWCYGEDGALLSETEAAGDAEAQTTKYLYDRAGRVIRRVGPWDDETHFEYDVWGRPHRMTLPNGAVRTLVFGETDLVMEDRLEGAVPSGGATRPLLHRQSYEYDARRRLVATTLASFRDDPATATPVTTRYLYDRDDNVLAVLLPRGAEHRYGFDTIGRLTRSTDLHGNVSHFAYDASGDLGAVTTVEVENGVTQTTTRRHTYDSRARLTRTEGLGSFAEFHYDDRNLPVEERAPTGVTNRRRFDPHSQVIDNVVDPGGLALRSRFEYDANGHLRRYVDPTGQATSWERDAFGRPSFVKPPDGTTWAYLTNHGARTIEQLTPSGNRTVLEYAPGDARPVRMICIAGPGHEAVAPHELAYDGLGRLVRTSVGAEAIDRRYDSLGRLIEETARGKTVRTEFDDVTGAVDRIFPDGRRERTEHNAAGQATRIVLVTPGDLGGTPGDLLLEIAYSTAGRAIGVTYGNGVEGQLAYDDLGRVIRVDYRKGAILLDSCRLRYDDGGHRAVVQYLGAPERNVVHRFDGRERLVEARSGFPLAPLADATTPVAQELDVAAVRLAAAAAPGVAFDVDDADTRSKDTSMNGGAASVTYASAADHRVTAVGASAIAYTLDGHRKSDARYEYELDALNRVRRVRDRATSVVVAELRYDALSRVAAGTTDGEVFERWFAGSTRVHEVRGLGDVRQHSSHPLWQSPFSVVDATGPNYVHQDEGLSTMCVTDANGDVLERHRHDVFGASAVFDAGGVTELSSLKTESIWRGMPTLGTTSRYASRRRLYDPEIGVFASRDPLIYGDSPSPYAYAAHDPVDFADATGFAKAPLAEKGYSIAPPPPVSGTNYRAYMPHGFLWEQYTGAMRDVENPDNPGWARVLLLGLAIVAAPVAGAEEYLGHGSLNIPFVIDNLGTGAGEQIGRASLWLEQGESAEATADLLGAVVNFALGFLNMAMIAKGTQESRATRQQAAPARPVKPGTPPALKRIDETPGLTKDKIIEQEMDEWARREGGVKQPSHYGGQPGQGPDGVYTFPQRRPLVVGEAKFKSGYELGHLEKALDQLKPSLRLGRQGSWEHSYQQGLVLSTSKAKTITPAVRQTGRLILEKLPDHRRVLVIGNEFGEVDFWDLDFWEMYEW